MTAGGECATERRLTIRGVVARRVIRRLGVRELSKHHGARRSLIKTDKLDLDFLINLVAGFINDNHSAVAEIGDALLGVAAGGDDFHAGALAGEVLGAQGKGELVKIEDVHMLGSGDFLEVVIVREDEAVIRLGKLEELIVDGHGGEIVVDDAGIEIDDPLEFANGVEASASTGAFLGIFAIGEKLELVSNAARNENLVTDKTGLGNG